MLASLMTYVIGITRFDTTAILVDSSIWIRDAAGNLIPDPEADAGIKNGVLYPGCIYGFAGNPERAYQFMQKMRSVAATKTGLPEKWEALEAAVRIYPFPRGEDQQFDMMLSSRHSGVPELFVVDSSAEELRRIDADIDTLGSGKGFLDLALIPFVRGMFTPDRLIGWEHLENAFTRLDYPYLLAFFLHMFCYGETGRVALEAGVSGLVHFVRQDSGSEERQKPSLYVLATHPWTGSRSLLRRRIAFDSHERIPLLIVVADKAYEMEADWVAAPATVDEPASIPLADVQAIVNATIDRHKRDRPYCFMAAGVIDWQLYNLPFFFMMDVDDGRREPWADMTDYLDPFVEDQLIGYMDSGGRSQSES
jgi:hypothetical protein